MSGVSSRKGKARAVPRRRHRARHDHAQQAEQILDLHVGEPAHGGACVARDDSGRVVFVRHTLPGEHVRARITSTRSHLAWADAIDVLEASPDRQGSVWPQAGPGGVGGGELAHVTPHAQREWKAAVIAGQLRRVGGAQLFEQVVALGGVQVRPAPGDEGGALLHRRARIEAVVDAAGRPGMHRYRSSDIIALDSMPLAAPAIEGLGFWGEASAWSDVLEPGDRVRLISPGRDSAVVVTPRAAFNALGEEIDMNRLRWSIDVQGQVFHYDVRLGGFWQTHVAGAATLADAVMRAAAVTDGDRLLELYSGAGLFSAPLATAVGPRGRLVTLEGDEAAVADAGENLARYGWVDVYSGGVDAASVAQLAAQLDRSPDVVVLDPPRSGAGREVCQALAALGAQRIVLVSCDPAAGARDLRDLAASGYRVTFFEAWDLFPHTHHVEVVTALSKL